MESWLRRWAPSGAPRLLLLALPPAGGAAHLFRPWANRLPLDVTLVGAELPGHGSRLAEPPLSTMEDLLDGLQGEVRGFAPVPLAVLGHSMGAIVGLALCRRLRRLDPAWRPAGFFAVGSEARRSRRTVDSFAGADTGALRRFLADTHGAGPHGADPRGAADPALQDLVLPALRADLALLSAYDAPGEEPLGCPVRVLAGADDPYVDAADRTDWAAESDGDFAVRLFAGGHFFYEDPAVLPSVLECVSAELNRLVAHTRA